MATKATAINEYGETLNGDYSLVNPEDWKNSSIVFTTENSRYKVREDKGDMYVIIDGEKYMVYHTLPHKNILDQLRDGMHKVVCMLKGHDFDSPHYKFLSEADCRKRTKCSRCGFFTQELISHELTEAEVFFTSDYLDRKNCKRLTSCKKCSHTITLGIQEHDISNAKVYFKSSGKDCVRMADCVNCRESITLGVQEHEVSNAQVYFKPSGKDCERTANCTNCDFSVKLSVQQHVEQRIETACETSMKCQNCNNIRILEDRHPYEYKSSRKVGKDVFDGLIDEWVHNSEDTYVCSRCGRTKTEFHSWKEKSQE